MTRNIAATHGTNRLSVIQTPYFSRYRSQILSNIPKQYQNSPSPLSPILKRSKPTPTVPVTVTSSPINEENIICIEDKTIWSSQSKTQTLDTPSLPPPPQTAPAAKATGINEATIPTNSTPRHRRHRRTHPTCQRRRLHPVHVCNRPRIETKLMLLLPIEYSNVKIDALGDSGAYINAISERDAGKIKQGAKHCIISKAPPPPFKVQYGNAELEQPLATYTMRFKIGDYTFEETLIEMNQTSFPLIGLAFLRKHSAILDRAQVTIDFPKIQITLALKD